jgi:hypothetical protein
MLGSIFGRRRRTGWRPSPADARDHGFERLGLSALKLPVRADVLAEFWPVHFDQGSTSSCTGNAVSAALAMGSRYTARDSSLPVPSRSALYYGGRALTAQRFGGSISDDGAYLRDVFDAARRVGVPFERDAPFEPRRINRPPPMGALVLGHGHRGGSYVRIFEDGEQKSLAVRTALAAGHPVVIGSPITVDYASGSGRYVFDVPAKGEPIAGGHAQVLSGYQPDALRGRLYRCVNSWGQGWGDHGDAWLSEAWVQWEQLEAWITYGWETRT